MPRSIPFLSRVILHLMVTPCGAGLKVNSSRSPTSIDGSLVTGVEAEAASWQIRRQTIEYLCFYLSICYKHFILCSAGGRAEHTAMLRGTFLTTKLNPGKIFSLRGHAASLRHKREQSQLKEGAVTSTVDQRGSNTLTHTHIHSPSLTHTHTVVLQNEKAALLHFSKHTSIYGLERTLTPHLQLNPSRVLTWSKLHARRDVRANVTSLPYLAGLLAGGWAWSGVTVELRRTGAHFIFIIIFLIKIHAAGDSWKKRWRLCDAIISEHQTHETLENLTFSTHNILLCGVFMPVSSLALFNTFNYT